MTDLTFKQLNVANVNRCEDVFHSVDSWSVQDWAIAVFGESGELCNAVKKLRRHKDGTNTAKDPQTLKECRQQIMEELADVVIYADLLATKLDMSLKDAICVKFNKVSRLRNSKYFL